MRLHPNRLERGSISPWAPRPAQADGQSEEESARLAPSSPEQGDWQGPSHSAASPTACLPLHWLKLLLKQSPGGGGLTETTYLGNAQLGGMRSSWFSQQKAEADLGLGFTGGFRSP